MRVRTIPQELFVGTTITTESLRSFVENDPNYLGWALNYFVNKVDRDQLNRTDFFEFHFQRYVVGYYKTLHGSQF